jgi:putative two-component system response regulator
MDDKPHTWADQAQRKTIMLVDDNHATLAAGKEILKELYRVYPMPSAEILFELLANVRPNLILLDIEMPGLNGYDTIKRLRATPQWADIPVIFLTGRTDMGSELKGLSMGAIDYVYKPFSAPLLLRRIETHLNSEAQKEQLKLWNGNLEQAIRERTKQVINLQEAILSTVANLVEFRDDLTGDHVMRTQKYLTVLVSQMIENGIYAEETALWDMDYLIPSAGLHDVGKIAISDLILRKPSKLTSEEFEIMKSHAAIGIEIIEKIERSAGESAFLRHARLIAGAHHEKWDGSGYPAGLAGPEIPLEGRLMAVADVYDALVSSRSYKPPFDTESANQIIIDGSGTHFDPLLISVFMQVADRLALIANSCDLSYAAKG